MSAVLDLSTRAGLLTAGFMRGVTAAVDPTVNDDAGDGYVAGQTSWLNTATGNVFDLIVSTAGAAVWRFRPRFWQSGAAVTIGSTTANTAVATIALAANVLGAHGRLDVDFAFDVNSTADDKTLRTYFGASGAGVGGTVLSGIVLTTSLHLRESRIIQNAGATNAQIAIGGTTGGYGVANAIAGVTAAIDTTAASEFVIAGQKETAGDTCILRHYRATLTRPDIGP